MLQGDFSTTQLIKKHNYSIDYSLVLPINCTLRGTERVREMSYNTARACYGVIYRVCIAQPQWAVLVCTHFYAIILMFYIWWDVRKKYY